MVDTRGTAVEVKLPSRLGFEKVAMGTAASVAKLMGFPDDRIEDLKTALAEACINAIEHGNRLDSSLCVGVILSASDEGLEVKVMDTGSGITTIFLPTGCSDATAIESAVRSCLGFSHATAYNTSNPD